MRVAVSEWRHVDAELATLLMRLAASEGALKRAEAAEAEAAAYRLQAEEATAVMRQLEEAAAARAAADAATPTKPMKPSESAPVEAAPSASEGADGAAGGGKDDAATGGSASSRGAVFSRRGVGGGAAALLEDMASSGALDREVAAPKDLSPDAGDRAFKSWTRSAVTDANFDDVVGGETPTRPGSIADSVLDTVPYSAIEREIMLLQQEDETADQPATHDAHAQAPPAVASAPVAPPKRVSTYVSLRRMFSRRLRRKSKAIVWKEGG